MNFAFTQFNGGEASPEMYGRVDLEKYRAMVKTLKNFVCLPHGPAVRRPGLEYIAETKDSTKESRLMSFEFSTTQAYILEFGDLYTRFYKDGGQITHVTTITGATQANPVVITAANRYVDGQSVTIAGVVGMTELNGNTYTVANASAADYELSGIDGTGYNAYVSDGTGTGIYEITTTYTESEIGSIDTAQSADTLYIVSSTHLPATLTRSDHDNWTLADMVFDDGPFMAQNITATTLTPSAVSGVGITITASSVVGINNGDGFISTDIGRLVTILHTATWGIARITAITDTTHVVATVLTDFAAITAQSAWKLGAWSDTTGYPISVTFDNDRLCFAGSPTFPQGIWMTEVGVYDSFLESSPVDAADALDLTLGAKRVNTIQWIESARRLAVGTVGAEWWLTSSTGDGPMTATSKQAVPGSQNGSAAVQPLIVGNIIIYLQRFGRVLRELVYSFDTDSYGGEELTILASHLTKKYAMTEMTFQRDPWKVIWGVRSDGTMLGVTYYKEQEVVGWHRHITDGEFESVSSIPGTNEDEVWVIVKRDINGSDVRYVERLHETFDGGDYNDTIDAFFVDSGLTLDNRQDIESISYANPGVITVTGHGYSDTDSIRIRSVDKVVVGEEDYTSLHNELFTVFSSAANTFQLKDADGNVVDLTEYKEVETATVAENVTAISGLDHLEGETVDVLADGAPTASKTVASGAITLDTSASIVHAGLPFISDLETLTPEVVFRDGSTQTTVKRGAHVTLRMNQSVGGQIGPDSDSLVDLQFVDDTIPLGEPPGLFSGDYKTSFKGKHRTNFEIFFRQNQPLPSTISALFAEVEM